MITALARAKINLCLHVTGKRADGYHFLDSIVVFADGGDEISAENAEQLSLKITGPFSEEIGKSEDNLVLKAARLLRRESGVKSGATIRLVKNLPVAAGIGGGSSDAAETLKLLNRLWNAGVPDEKLAEMGLSLGADIPVCLFGKPALMSGIGERLSGLPELPDLYILLVNSGVKISTAEVFRRFEFPQVPDAPPVNQVTRAPEILSFLENTRNDLDAAALELAPEIAVVISEIKSRSGCRFVRMSGSGATCFGLFETEGEAAAAAARIQSRYPSWWVRAWPLIR